MNRIGKRLNSIEEKVDSRKPKRPWARIITCQGEDAEPHKLEKVKELGGKTEDYRWMNIVLVSPQKITTGATA
jgi:hypothetical protein